MRSIATDYIAFAKRRQRTEYIADKFRGCLKGSVLDVGCYDAPLREMLPDVEYFGIDIVGQPDLKLDLEATDRLPFDDGRYECVVCVEVLEHLDGLHRIFDELVRVAGRHLIVSLPNCWRAARRQIDRGYGTISHYHLPAERPPDRHKWFINISQAREFFEAKANDQLVLKEMRMAEKPQNALVNAFRRLRYNPERYANRYAHTLFAWYEKRA